MPLAEKTRAEELHDEYRRKVWDDIRPGTENFDKYMLTFSSGALVLSLAFIKDVVPIKKAIWIPSLVSSWIAFVLCILVTLISFRISIRALEEMAPFLDAFYLEGKPEAFNKHHESRWTQAVDWCANLAIVFFILGLAFTMAFVGVNIREAKRMSDKETTEKVFTGNFEEGLKPPAMTPVQPKQQQAPAPAPAQSEEAPKK